MQYPASTELAAQNPSIPPHSHSRSPLWRVAELPQLDEAVDYAARVCKAVVGEFLAAPGGGGQRAMEVAIEFLVPPSSVERFAEELDRAMVRRSLGYSADRREGRTGAAQVTVLPSGAFHQWRAAWRQDARVQRARRWSVTRQFIDGIVQQARTGWRETSAFE
jgi:hypothetical protein